MHRGHRVLFVVLTNLVLVALTATVALAASPHFKRGGDPRCSILGSGASVTTTCRASLAGLGNDDLLINVTTNGAAVYECQNHGGNIAPGQNKVLVGPETEPTLIDSDAIKNGNVSFTTNPNVLEAPDTVSGAAAGCPNGNWTGVNPTLTLTSISMVIEQPPGTVIFSCSASDPDGLSGEVALSC